MWDDLVAINLARNEECLSYSQGRMGAEKTRSWYLGFWFMNSRPRPPLSSQYLTVIGSLQTASELVQVYDILVSRILTVELNSPGPEVARVDIKYPICLLGASR